MVGAIACAKDETRTVLTITENGLGKRTELAEFSLHNRGGKGMKCHNLNDRTGLLNGIALVNDEMTSCSSPTPARSSARM